MANSSKRKGDAGEREAVRVIQELAPDLISVFKAQRKLGAGRREDVGDLDVFHDCAIQVRNLKKSDIGTAIRSAAVDGAQQARNGGLPFGVGLVPVPGARRGSVRWLASAVGWPSPVSREPVQFAQVGRMVIWLRDDEGPHGYDPRPRHERLATMRHDARDLLVAPVEAWLSAFRVAPRTTSERLLRVPA